MNDQPGVSRRALLGTIAAAAVAAVGLTAGQSFGWLAPLNVFAPRVPGRGPQGVPVNTTAASAGVVETARAADWTLAIRNGDRAETLDRARLLALPQARSTLPIACVEGWSTTAEWSGVRMRDLLALVGASAGATVLVTSLQPRGAYRRTTMGPEFAQDPDTLVALTLNGETLDLDHGYPARVIAPGRPGVLQTKWLSSIEVVPA
ncbi:molybdopterin-dependent oxidoreductase [Leifsonia sp. 22587]|uniref:molybdopterin-dependent oxidoreductase n=1 Tax=Leifsonia sp. 22587 TaxID=3453946 RepID=UPI003F874D2F